jgi:hypothetical protein
MMSDVASHQNHRIRADKHVIFQNRRTPIDACILPLGDTSSDRRVREDLRPAGNIAAAANTQASLAIDQSECPDPCAVTDLWVTNEPCMRIVPIGRNAGTTKRGRGLFR